MARIKILVAGDPGSIHTNRFVSLLQEIGYDVRVFQSENTYWQEEHLRNTVLYVSSFVASPENGNTLKICSPCELNYNKNLSFFLYAVKSIFAFCGIPFRVRERKYELAKVIRKWRPDLIFSLKMQNDGYTVSETKELMKGAFSTPWVHFNWGTDIELFGKHPHYIFEHLPKINKMLSQCNFHIADCKRDVRQAADFGFTGTSLGECLATGGFDLEYLQEIKQVSGNKRDVILVKGRDGGFVGKAFNVLAALHRIPNLIKSYQIKIIMPTDDVKGAASFLSRLDGINYEIVPRLPYRELLALFGRSRIAISASDVDGTPSFLVEAMAMGVLPIHSDMESARELVVDGVNGLLFSVDNINELVIQIKRGLADDNLVEKAKILNWEIVEEKMNRDKIRNRIKYLVEERILVNR